MKSVGFMIFCSKFLKIMLLIKNLFAVFRMMIFSSNTMRIVIFNSQQNEPFFAGGTEIRIPITTQSFHINTGASFLGLELYQSGPMGLKGKQKMKNTL